MVECLTISGPWCRDAQAPIHEEWEMVEMIDCLHAIVVYHLLKKVRIPEVQKEFVGSLFSFK